MEYLCLVYLDGKQLGALSKSEMEVVDRDSMAYDDELRRSGHYELAAKIPMMRIGTIEFRPVREIVRKAARP
jgi:hypothetical protein